MGLRDRTLGLALLCAAGVSHALVLGPVTGTAWIGRPLDLVIQVQGAMGEDAVSSCFEAEVYHGDSRQEASRVRLVAQAGNQPQLTEVRVASMAAVDEPLVTVQVRAICGQKVSRQYVLLADLPRDSVVPMASREVNSPGSPSTRLEVAAIVSAEPTSAAAAALANVSAAPNPAAQDAPASVTKPAPARAVPKKRPVARAAAATPRAPVVKARDQGKPPPAKARLVLDSLEMLSDRVASLETATAEVLKPDLSNDAQKVRSLEADVKALLALAANNEVSLLELKARLQKAEADRLPNEVFYTLLALLLAGLAWGLWSRRQRHTGAWSASVQAQDAVEPRPQADRTPVPAPTPLQDPAAAKTSRLQALSDQLDRTGPPSEVDVSLIEMSESNFDKLMQSDTPQNAIRSPVPVRPTEAAKPSHRGALSADAVFDIRQQAEFFVSLGQTDQAIRVLEEQISATDAPNPLVYLDLLALLHVPSRKTDFRRVREDFSLLFNANAPEFAQFKDEGKSLEAYPDVLSAVAKLWPDPKVLAVIEACIVRDPWGSSSQPFDLAAFRDLLFLHAVAQTMVALPAAKRASSVATSLPTVRAGLASSAPAASPDLARPDILLDDMGPISELDLDLTDTYSGGPTTIPTTPP